jgi:hypothetical protein
MLAQGLELIIPSGMNIPDADLAVFPSLGSPEYRFYYPLVERKGIPSIVEEDPIRGITRSIVYPRHSFRTLIFGVDPGGMCGLVALGDGYLVHAGKYDCNMLGDHIEELGSRIPAEENLVYVGDGQGLDKAINSLTQHGVPFHVVPEVGSTSYHVKGPLEELLKDKDLLASLTIALRGRNQGVQNSYLFPGNSRLRRS